MHSHVALLGGTLLLVFALALVIAIELALALALVSSFTCLFLHGIALDLAPAHPHVLFAFLRGVV
jgi:hypothetical protein